MAVSVGFGSFFSHLVAPVTKALGPIGTAALLPAIPLTQIAANVIDVAGAKIGSTLLGPGMNVAPRPAPQTFENAPQPFHGTQPVTYYFAPSYAPAAPAYGGSPWDYSTPSIASFPQPSPTYQAYSPPAPVQGDRSWEDLILGSALFL